MPSTMTCAIVAQAVIDQSIMMIGPPLWYHLLC